MNNTETLRTSGLTCLAFRYGAEGRTTGETSRGRGLELGANWACGIPLIILNVSLHVIGLGFIYVRIIGIARLIKNQGGVIFTFALVMGIATLFVTLLPGIEATIWAGAYILVEALSDGRSALLYSVSAITSYGHANLVLAARWQLLGALEALNGMILFGLTTATLYGMIQRVWPIVSGTPSTLTQKY